MEEKQGKWHGRQVVLYLFWGCTITCLNLILYLLLQQVMDYKAANAVSIVSAKVYAYFVNKRFVFHSKCAGWKELLQETTAYVLSRGFTGILDFAGVLLLVEQGILGRRSAKYIMTAAVMAFNYLFGKKLVFVNRGKQEKTGDGTQV